MQTMQGAEHCAEISAIKSRTVKLLPQNEINGSAYGDELYECPPEFDGPAWMPVNIEPFCQEVRMVTVSIAFM